MVIQQVVQTAVGWLLGMTEPDDVVGKEEYDVAVWARRIRLAQRAIPGMLALLGIDASGLAKDLNPSHPVLAGVILGGRYSALEVTSATPDDIAKSTPGFTAWERVLASALYWYIVPATQYAIAIVVVDTWQYFLHRAMHMNKWLYSK